MAGHAGAFLATPDGSPYLLKIVDENEYYEYYRIIAINENGSGKFPLIYGLWDGKNWIYSIEYDKEINDEVDLPNLSDSAQGKHVVAIQKLKKIGGVDGHLYDFKIGKQTASKSELISNGYKNSFTAAVKKWKMNIVDWKTDSSKYGVRDSDNTSDINGIEVYFESLPGEQRQSFKDQFIRQCTNIYGYIQQARTLYIASSILVGCDDETHLVVRLIDLAHPVTEESVGFRKLEKYREGMLLGIQNLMKIVNGDELITRLPEDGQL
jgi:hypothetical protein